MEEFELEPRESVTISVRTHIFVLFLRLLPFVLLALAPFILSDILRIVTTNTPGLEIFSRINVNSSNPLARFMLGTYLLFIWIGIFGIFTRYYLTIWIITTTRIVDIKQSGFFRREVSSFLLNRVQDVTTNVNGILATLIGYGTLEVETAGSDEKFFMRGIVNPEGVRDLIMKEVALLHADGTPPVSSL
jgi:uncharacterized membrane protein YdbT with pleckstrin-like domain